MTGCGSVGAEPQPSKLWPPILDARPWGQAGKQGRLQAGRSSDAGLRSQRRGPVTPPASLPTEAPPRGRGAHGPVSTGG